jgi:S-DNA-T family DNA segregation ATPase FtsK/SpoIIIE
VLSTLPVVLAPAWTMWGRYVHPRPRVRIEGGSRRPWEWEAWCFRRGVRRHLGRIIGEWPETAANASVPGSRIRLAEGDRVSYRLHIDLRPGQTLEDLSAARGRLESALGSKRNRVRIAGDGFADRAVLTWALGDPLSGITKWEGPAATSVTEPITIATYQDGQPLSVPFSEGVHWLVTGQTGMGKSSLVDLLVGSFAACSDVVIWACDPEDGVSLGKWEAVLGWLSDEETALAMLDAVMAVHRLRLPIMRAAGVSDWTAELGPFLVVILDEFPVLSTAAKALASKIAKRARKSGVRLMVLAQVSSAEEVGSTALRGSLKGVICFGLQEPKHADFAFPAGGRERGWDPLKLEKPGDVLVKSPWHREPVPARTFLVDADAARSWAAELASTDRPRIELPAHGRPGLVTDGDDDEGSVLQLPEADDDDDAEEEPDRVASREELILEVLRAAGEPIPGREVARRAGLPNSKVAGTDLPELERRGLIAHEREGTAKLWRIAAEAAEARR